MAKKKKIKRARPKESHLESQFYGYWSRLYPNHLPKREYVFSDQRAWRFDFAWFPQKVALEIQGAGPGHFSVSGATKDYDKLLDAIDRDWTVLYFTSSHLSPKRIRHSCLRLAKILKLPPPEKREYVPFTKRKF